MRCYMDKMLFNRHQSMPIYDLYFLRTRPSVADYFQPTLCPFSGLLLCQNHGFSGSVGRTPTQMYITSILSCYSSRRWHEKECEKKTCLCLAVFIALTEMYYFWHSSFATQTSFSYYVSFIFTSPGCMSPVAVLTHNRPLPSLPLFSILLFITLCQCHLSHS